MNWFSFPKVGEGTDFFAEVFETNPTLYFCRTLLNEMQL